MPCLQPHLFSFMCLVSEEKTLLTEDQKTQPHITVVEVNASIPQTKSDDSVVEVEPTPLADSITLKTMPRPKSTTWETIVGVAEEGWEITRSLVPQMSLPKKWPWS